jgi:hypothetical protein
MPLQPAFKTHSSSVRRVSTSLLDQVGRVVAHPQFTKPLSTFAKPRRFLHFWNENRKALRQIFKQSAQLAVRAGAVGLVLQALDGTKIEAAANSHSGWNKKYMEKLLAALDAALDQTELALVRDNNDPTGYRLPAGLAERQALREQVKAGLAQLAADGRNHYHPVEPEARRMKVRGANRFAYNAQAVVDGKEGVIVACEANRQETDAGQLVPMIEQARENLGVASPETTTLADAGYGAGADLQAAQASNLSVLVPPAEGKPAADNPYASQHFRYDAQARTVTCPQGRRLDHQGHTTRFGQRVERYHCHCRDCPVRAQCARDPKGRHIEIWPHTAVVQAMRAKLQEPLGQALHQQRRQIIERRFGQIKQHDGFRRWTVWGLESVRTQWSLLCATLNLRLLYKRWRQEPPTGPRATGAMTGRRAKPGFWWACLLHPVQQMQAAVERTMEQSRPWLLNWAQ